MERTELLKIAKPALFNTEMVRAILDRRKRATRRVVKIPDNFSILDIHDNTNTYVVTAESDLCPQCYKDVHSRYKVGDYLYVRETHTTLGELDGNDQPIDGTVKTYYKADNTSLPFNEFLRDDGSKKEYPAWTPSIHMPKEAARIFLKVTAVRVERVQDITEEQAKDEGATTMTTPNIAGSGKTYIQGFGELWNSTTQKEKLAKYGWNANPWVWVYEFDRVEVD